MILATTEKLFETVSGPVGKAIGPNAKVLTVELHGYEVRGLVACSGRVLRYVLEAESSRIRTREIMAIAISRMDN